MYAVPRPSDFIRVGVLHVQYLAVIAGLNTQWPTLLGWFLEALSALVRAGPPPPCLLLCLPPKLDWQGRPCTMHCPRRSPVDCCEAGRDFKHRRRCRRWARQCAPWARPAWPMTAWRPRP
jgi:hypothetical protein